MARLSRASLISRLSSPKPISSMMRRVNRPFWVNTWISWRFTASPAADIATLSSTREFVISSLPRSDAGSLVLPGPRSTSSSSCLDRRGRLSSSSTCPCCLRPFAVRCSSPRPPPPSPSPPASLSPSRRLHRAALSRVPRNVLEGEELIEAVVEGLLFVPVFGSTSDSERFRKARSS